MSETLIINNQAFKLKSNSASKIQTLIDDIVLLSKMLDYIEEIRFIEDEHPSFLKVGYILWIHHSIGSVKFLFSIQHDYSYEKKQYIKGNFIHCLSLQTHFFTGEFFNFHNSKIQIRGINEIKTCHEDAMVEMLEEVKRYILHFGK